MPTENGSLVDPRTASDGIHEMLVTERSILMGTRVARPAPARKGADTYAVVGQAPPRFTTQRPRPSALDMASWRRWRPHFDGPEYAGSRLSEGAAGYAYLLKDRVAEGDSLASAVRAVASGGSRLDPHIVDALMSPVTEGGGLSPPEEALLQQVAEGKPIKAIAAAQRKTAAAVS